MTCDWEWASVRTIYRYFWTLHHHFNLTQWTQSTLGLLWSSYHTWNILHWPKRTGKRDNWKKKNRFDNKVKVMTMWGKKKKCWGTFYSFAAVPRPLCYNSRNHPLKDKKLRWNNHDNTACRFFRTGFSGFWLFLAALPWQCSSPPQHIWIGRFISNSSTCLFVFVPFFTCLFVFVPLYLYLFCLSLLV